MNIFAIDSDPLMAASWLVDKHVVKMPVEYAQMLCTAHWVSAGISKRKSVGENDADGIFRNFPDGCSPYLPTHVNHPSSAWARETLGNYMWLAAHAKATCKEYTRRYKRIHASEAVIDWCATNIPTVCGNDVHITPFKLAMPIEFKIDEDRIESYRNYYRYAKTHIHSWKIPECKPNWI
jgi:hypothetical protein